MSRHAARARSGSGRTSLYDEIATKIITELEAGRVPWVQPWGTAAAKAPLAMPKNAATERFYSGINVLILWGSVIEHGFPTRAGLRFARPSASAAMSARASTAPPSSMPTASFPPTRRNGRERPARKRSDPFPQALHRLQPGAMRRPPRIWSWPRRLRTWADRADGRGADQGDGDRLPHRRRPGLLHARARLCAGPAAASLFRADQLASHGAARARSRQWRPTSAKPRPDGHLRLEEVCVRGTGRRDERRVLLHLSRELRRPCATPITSARGSRSCAKITAPSCALLRRPAKPLISFSAFSWG